LPLISLFFLLPLTLVTFVVYQVVIIDALPFAARMPQEQTTLGPLVESWQYPNRCRKFIKGRAGWCWGECCWTGHSGCGGVALEEKKEKIEG